MAFSREQLDEARRQILEQVKSYPEEKKREIEEQINRMSAEELEEFVKQQISAQQSRGSGGAQGGQAQKGIFRMIVDGDVPSKKVDENKEAIAVLSVKAVSRGHVLIIPRKSVSDVKFLPLRILNFAKKIAKRQVLKLKAHNAEIQTEFLFGEIVVDVIPVYDKPVSVTSPRYDVSENELEEIYKLLRIVKREKPIRIRQTKGSQEKVVKLSRRIP